MDWSMAEMWCFFSQLVDSSATEVRRQISGRGWADWRQQNNAFSWNDWRRQHNATSSMRRWTDQQQSHDASSLGWSMVGLVTCDGESACKGGLINGGKTMLILGMIDNGDTTLFYRLRVDWSTAETWCLFSWLVNGLAANVWWQISMHGRTDQWRQHYAFSWYDWRRRHNATSSGRGCTDWWWRHGTSSLSWLTFQLVMCDGESVCAGGLIESGDTASLGWLMVGGNTRHSLGATDKILRHAEIKHYTNVGTHHDYTSAITVIGAIWYYRTEYNRKE